MKSCKTVLLTLFAAVLALVLVPASAFAGQIQTTFSVTATVQATCLVSANTLAFGTYSGVQLDGTTTVGVTCTNTTPYTVGFDAGTFAGATVTTRRMTGPAVGSAVLFVVQRRRSHYKLGQHGWQLGFRHRQWFFTDAQCVWPHPCSAVCDARRLRRYDYRNCQLLAE